MGRDLLAPVWCWWPTTTGGKCPSPAGYRTDHPGYGPCESHEPWEMRKAWRLAMAMAEELDVSPWEALTKAVRLAAARVEWVDAQLRTTINATDGNPTDHRVLTLLAESRAERKLLSATAKSAIDAGVAERLVRQVELEGKVLARVLDVALDAANLDEGTRLVALEAAHRHLTATVEAEGGAWAVPGAASGARGGVRDVPYVADDPEPETDADGPPEPPPPPPAPDAPDADD